MRTEAWLHLQAGDPPQIGPGSCDAPAPAAPMLRRSGPSARLSMRAETASSHPEAHGEAVRDSKDEGRDRQTPLRVSPSLRPSTHQSTRIPTPRSLAAMAVMVAGVIIAAQAVFMPAKAQVAQVLLDRAWQTQLETGEPARPWPWADFSPEARIAFPELGRNVLALSDAAGESMAFGPSRVAASARPGEPGVAVYAAHRDTHFRFLDRLTPGDPVVIETRDGALEYKVIGSSVVPWNASGISMHQAGSSRLALVTCWPLDGKVRGPMRYVVWADLVEQPA